jgi:hypothetical protein
MIEEACEYGFLPEDTTEGTIALIYKNKGDPRDMRNIDPSHYSKSTTRYT